MDQGWRCWIRDMGQRGLCYLKWDRFTASRQNNQVTHQNSWRNTIARRPSGACGMIPMNMRNSPNPRLVFCLLRAGDGHTHIISAGISKDVVQCIRFGDILRCFANNDYQLNFVVWEVILRRLSYFGDDDGGQGSNERCDGFIE